MKRTYEDEKREALASYLSDKPKLREAVEFKERDLKLMKIKTDLHIIGRLSINKFRSTCNAIIRSI